MSGALGSIEDQLAAARAMIQQQGAPMTAENLNRASLHTATAGGMGPLLFDQAMERAVGNPTPRQARQASSQPLPGPPPPTPGSEAAPPVDPAMSLHAPPPRGTQDLNYPAAASGPAVPVLDENGQPLFSAMPPADVPQVAGASGTPGGVGTGMGVLLAALARNPRAARGLGVTLDRPGFTMPGGVGGAAGPTAPVRGALPAPGVVDASIPGLPAPAYGPPVPAGNLNTAVTPDVIPMPSQALPTPASATAPAQPSAVSPTQAPPQAPTTRGAPSQGAGTPDVTLQSGAPTTGAANAGSTREGPLAAAVERSQAARGNKPRSVISRRDDRISREDATVDGDVRRQRLEQGAARHDALPPEKKAQVEARMDTRARKRAARAAE